MATKLDDPWQQTVRLLRALSRNSSGATTFDEKLPRNHYDGMLMTVSIEVIDRPSLSTAIIAWRDPTSCCYGDQVWRESTARRKGICALTNQRITAGDRIYKPRACKVMQKNAHAMILASVVYAHRAREHLEPK